MLRALLLQLSHQLQDGHKDQSATGGSNERTGEPRVKILPQARIELLLPAKARKGKNTLEFVTFIIDEYH